MTRQRALLAGLGLLLVGLPWLVFRDGGMATSAVEAPAQESRIVGTQEVALEGSALETPASDPATPVSGEGRVAAALPEFEVQAPEPELAHIVGRLLLPGGGPAADVILVVHGWSGGSERKQKYGEPEDWVDLQGTTDAEGCFDIAFDPPRALQFALDANLDGYADLSWRWRALPPRETTDVGDQIFVAAGTVAGRVVGADGSPTGTVWTVYAESHYGPTGDGADETFVFARTEADTGIFRFENLPPGRVQLRASSQVGTSIRGRAVRVREGEETRVRLVYDGPDQSRRIVVGTSYRPFFAFGHLERDIVTCMAADGRMIASAETSHSTRRYSFEDLDPGTYTIEVTSPGFQPWSQSGVRPGEAVTARLKGNAAVTLLVRDAETGEEVVDYGLRLRFEGANFSTNIFQVREPGSERPAGGLYEGLIPFDTTLIVRAEGFAPLEIPLGELAPNTTSLAEGELLRGGTVRGVVLEGNGQPAKRATVLLHPYLEGYDPDDSSTWLQGMSQQTAFRSRSLDAETDANGRFLLEGITPGDYGLLVTSRSVFARQEHVAVATGASQHVTLRLPGTGAITGRLSGPPQSGFDGLQIVVLPAGIDHSRMGRLRLRSAQKLPAVDVGEGGTFHVAEVREGLARIYLGTPATRRDMGFSGSMTLPGALIPLGEVLVRAGEEAWVEFDLARIVPGTIVLDVRLNGEPAPGLTVEAVKRGEDEVDLERVWGTLDAEGRVRLSPIFEGAWQLRVGSDEGTWSYLHPSHVSLDAGDEVQVSIDITLAVGRVRILDVTDGTPLAASRILVLGAAGGRAHTTDSEGWLELELTPGSYELRVAGDGEVRSPTVAATPLEWTSGGPAQAEVRVTRAEQDQP